MKRSTVTFDVETIGDPISIAIAARRPDRGFKPDKRWKPETVEVKREAYMEKFYASLTEKAGLNTSMNMLVSIGIANDDGGCAITITDAAERNGDTIPQSVWASMVNDVVLPDEFAEAVWRAEATMLQIFWRIVKPYKAISGFNIASFDLPTIRNRSILHRRRGVAPTHRPTMRRYTQGKPWVDTRMFLTDWDQYQAGKLQDWSDRMGIPAPGKEMGIEGKDVARLVAEGLWDDVRKYNEGDAVGEHDLYTVLAPSIFPQR